MHAEESLALDSVAVLQNTFLFQAALFSDSVLAKWLFISAKWDTTLFNCVFVRNAELKPATTLYFTLPDLTVVSQSLFVSDCLFQSTTQEYVDPL